MSPSQLPNPNFLWFLPTHGDGHYLGTATGGREVDFNYLRQIAQSVDQLGYFALGHGSKVTKLSANTGPFGETIANEHLPRKQAVPS
jgi:hypothetical protein